MQWTPVRLAKPGESSWVAILLHQQMPMPEPNPTRSQAEQIVTFAARHSGARERRRPNAERRTLIKPAAAIGIMLGCKTKLDLFASDPRGG
jgi:hypothetical protein